jgi:hypothetical protein
MFYIHAATDDLGLSASPDDLPEIESALEDLNDDPNMGSFGSGPYWPKIRERLLGASSSQDVKEAIKEWRYIRMWIGRGQCELCDHQPIVYHFQIENRINKNRLILGSECINNYLQIEGVPSKEVLRKRLNQLRAMAKAQEKGEVGEDAMQAIEALQNLEREVNILIGKVSRPDPDINVSDYLQSLNVPYYRLNMLGGSSMANKTAAEIVFKARELETFLKSLQKRSSLYKTTTMLPAVEAIMRFRDMGERRAKLEQLRKHINETFKLGAAEEAIELIWAEVRTAKKAILAKYLEKVETLKTDIQKRYQREIDQLKPYPHLAFMIQAGVNALKEMADADAAKIVESVNSIESTNTVNRMVLGSWTLKGPSLNDYGFSNKKDRSTLVAGADDAQRIYSLATGHAFNYAAELMVMYQLPKVQDVAGVTHAILSAADDGEIDGDSRTWLSNPKLIARFEEEVDEIKSHLKEAQGQKVFEAMGADLKFDVQKFYKCVEMSNEWLVGFGKSIFVQWKRGVQKGLSFKQRQVIEREIGKGKTPGRSLWDEMESEFNKRNQAKFAYSYAR